MAYKVGIFFFDENKTDVNGGNFVKNDFQNLAKWDKIFEHERTKYHHIEYKKHELFLKRFEDPTQSIIHDKKGQSKYACNAHILKMIIEEVILSTEQGLALRALRKIS